MKAVFAGTPEFSVSSMEALMAHPDIEVVAVFTQPDRPAGRGKKLHAPPIKRLAESRGIDIYQPQSFKSARDIESMAQLAPALIVVCAYGLLLPLDILKIPKLGCINVHASLLPRWRGAAPIQRAIEAGDQVTGITIMEMAEGLDTGNMLSKMEIPIANDETGGSLHDKLSVAGGALLSDSLDGILNGTLNSEPQDNEQATYAKKLNKSEAAIDWHQSAKSIVRKIRAFNPWPMARTVFDGSDLRILDARLESAALKNQKLSPGNSLVKEAGEIIRADKWGIWIATGSGNLVITALQKPGGKPMDVQAFLNGVKLTPGSRFG